MKIIFLASVALLFVIIPAYGQPLSDATGLVNRLDIQTGGYSFEIETASNFNIRDFEFDKDQKKLTLQIKSGLENNLGELLIPQNLLGGNLTFYLNDQEYFPKVNVNEKISFVTLNFTGSGDNQLEIFGTTHFFGLTEIDESDPPNPSIIPLADNGDELIYILIITLLLIIGIVAVVIFAVKRKK